MKKQKHKSKMDELIKKRIAALEWKKGIQQPEERIAAAVVDVLYGEGWTKEKYKGFTEEEKKVCNHFFEAALNSLAGQDYDQFWEKVLPIVNDATRQNIEEVRHVRITNAIDRLFREKNRFPTKCEIVRETGYSHKAVNGVLENYKESSLYRGRKEELNVMRERMIDMCYQHGLSGNMKAARLFLEYTEDKKVMSINKSEQNNFIQINGYTITPEDLKMLPAEKQVQVNEIVHLLNKTKQEIDYVK